MRIRAELRFKNEELISRRLLAGYKTQADFAEAVGITATTIGRYENFKGIPRNTRIILHLEELLNCDITDIFPEYLKAISEKLKARKKIVDLNMLQPYMTGGLLPAGPDEAYELKELKEFIIGPLQELTERERDILVLDFGLFGEEPHTLRAIGKIYDLSPERIRQIKLKALRKLKHPSRTRDLRCALGEDYFKSLERMKYGYTEPEPKEIEEEEIEEEDPEKMGPPPPWLDGREDGFIHKPLCRPDCPVCGGIEFKPWREK